METEVTVGKGQTITLDALQIKIPAVPPSTRKNTCHIICVTYMIKVTVQIPWGFNLDVGLPIAIGTIPRRKSTQAPQQSSAFELDARDTITYTRCEFGITPCTKSHENFVNFPYTPMCAYVPEGSLGLPTLPQAAAAAAAAPSTKPQKQQQAAKESKRDGQIHVSGGAMAPAHPLNPSLPLASPPTYEDVLKMDQEGQARTPQAASPMKASPVLPEPAMDPCAFLLMRFPDLLLADFRNLLQQEHDCLEEYNASVVAIAPQVITQHASSSRVWPERTAVAVLIFPAMTTAEEWFSSLASRNLTWLNNCDTVLSPGKWHYPTEDRLSFSLTILQRKDNIAEEEVKTYLKNNASPYAEFRKKCRGILPFSSSKDLKTLSGTWLTPGVDTLVLGAWPSLSSYFTYKEMSSSYASEHPSPYDNLAVIFVSENTAWFNAKAASAAQDVCNGASSHDDNSNDADAEKEEKAEDVLSESEKFRGLAAWP
ncbi:uncharacterized protein LOC112553272 [Pomacea canaliculata]|uniref:uncharacterized protein LOC112553272 n=1 Tax=Pomacea canaliculata TaxID=400727 RepID=UPI000D7383A8|nr:uncharacterized protein LOC112553272 [Pomacea canaliculata]XP_025076164.1 uncharacterized protein LOC112553272 [Pomacea canaliculata]